MESNVSTQTCKYNQLVERMWQYVKYILLGGKVNRRLDDLILAIIGNPETGQRFGEGTLVDHYDRAH